jgi:hypothetical protein
MGVWLCRPQGGITTSGTHLERLPNLILERRAKSALSAFACPRWVTKLDHEALDVAVEEAVVVVVCGAQREEVLQESVNARVHQYSPLRPLERPHRTPRSVC